MSKRWLVLLLLGVVWMGGIGVAHASLTLTVTPSSLDFGSITVNQSSTKDAVLSVSGGSISSGTVALEAGGDCSEFQIVSSTSVNVSPSTSQTVTVAFAPTSAGTKNCAIDVNDSSGTLIQSFNATGTATIPTPSNISVAPTPLPFGNVDVTTPPTTSTPISLVATNNGDVPLTISSGSFTAGGSDYTIVSSPSGLTLQNGDTATWTIACKPSAPGQRNGTFEIVSDASNTTTLDVPLTCFGAQAALVVNPMSIAFGLVQKNTTQSATFTLKNTGNVPVTGITGALSPTNKGYAFDPATVPNTLAASGSPGDSVTLTATFSPVNNTDGGAAAITFAGSWGNSETATATLGLSGSPAHVSASQTALDFGSFRFDTHPTRTYQITNDGGAAITITSADFTPDNNAIPTSVYSSAFTLAGSTVMLPHSLGAGQHLDVTVTAQAGNLAALLSGHIDVITNIPGMTPPRVTVTGTSTAAAVTATPMLDFGAVDIDATQFPPQNVTIKNTGTADLDILSLVKMNVDPAFTISLPTLAPLAPNATLTIPVTYKPTMERPAGQFDSATLAVSFGGVLPSSTPPSMIAIQGRGIDRHLKIDPVPTFPPTYRNPGDKAPLRTVTIHNTGEATLSITAEMFSSSPGGLELVGSDPSPIDILGGDTHTFTVKFSPTTVGTVTGQLVLTNNDNAKPMAMVDLTAVAMDRNIHFGPGMINLGFTGVGIPITATGVLTVSNMNPSDGFMIRDITLDDGSVFHIDNMPSNTLLPSGGTQTFSITFTPTSINHFQTTAHLHIDQDPTDEGGMDVQISGEAVFADAHGSGGCNAGGAGSGGGLLLGLAALGLGRRRRRRRVPAVALAAAGATLALSPAAHSDDIGIAVFEPTPATTGTGFALQAPDVGASGNWVVNAVASYASNPLVLDSLNGTGGSATRSALVERSTLMQLGFAYALLDRFELGAHIPLYQQSGENSPTGAPASGFATGDLAVHAKARLWRGGLGGGTLVAGASAAVVLPTASKGQFTGSGQMEGRFLVLGAFTPAALGSRLTLSVNAGPVLRGTSTYANISEKSGVAWGAGASYRILDELWGTAELFGESTPSGKTQEPVGSTMPPAITLSPIEALAGLSIRPERRFALGLALGRGVTDAIGTPDLRAVLSLSIVPGGALAPIHAANPDGDADGDGIPDSIDKCPNEPEDKDGFEDQDGCPDPDNDHDGIPDKMDKCPLDPEDKDGFQDDDGCPDPDNDHDGIPDKMDKCPNEPEDKDGFEDLDGCPDPDNDHDGIPDAKDKCPNQPETINGFQDEDGCPDKGDSTIILSPDRIETLDPIQFSGVKLTKADNPLLEQVAATLRAHAEIVRLRVTVHVQPTGDDDADQAKSDKRAQAVRDWLVQWGIAPARLEVRGFGGTKPLVPPDQRGAAKINDRLELIILERK